MIKFIIKVVDAIAEWIFWHWHDILYGYIIAMSILLALCLLKYLAK